MMNADVEGSRRPSEAVVPRPSVSYASLFLVPPRGTVVLANAVSDLPSISMPSPPSDGCTAHHITLTSAKQGARR
jgi:hypothetical protein